MAKPAFTGDQGMDSKDLPDRKTFRFAGSGTMQEEAAKDAFPVFAENLYVAELIDYGMVEEEETEWTPGGYVKTGNKVDRIDMKFQLLRTVAGGPVLDIKGQSVKMDKITLFPRINLQKLGYSRAPATKGQPLKSRIVLTALFGLSVDAAIPEFDDTTLMNKKVQVYIGVIKKDNGEFKNVMDKFTPYNETAK
jgi:hypothetical protein